MFLPFEITCTLFAAISFLVLLFMEPPYSRHSFEVESNPDYPDKLAFAPSPLSKASILLTNEILVDSYTNSEYTSSSSTNMIMPSVALVNQLSFFSDLCTGQCRTMAKNLIFEDWEEKDFQLELNEFLRRLESLSKNTEKIQVFNMFFREKKFTLSMMDAMKFKARYDLRKLDLEEMDENQTIKEYIDSIAGDYGHSVTEGLFVDQTAGGIILSFLDINLKMQDDFYQFVGSKYKFNNKGWPS